MVRYYEDLTIGETETVGSYTIKKGEIISFAEQFDPQPFHIDEQAAKNSMFGGLVASGLHTLCLSVRLFIDGFVLGENGIANMGGLGMDELRWHEPVRPGDTLTLQVEVADKRPSTRHADRGYAELNRTVSTESDPVMSFVSHNIIERQK